MSAFCKAMGVALLIVAIIATVTNQPIYTCVFLLYYIIFDKWVKE